MGLYLKDPAALVAAIRKDLCKWKQGTAITGKEGPLQGTSLVD
jgi:hypothetical protein